MEDAQSLIEITVGLVDCCSNDIRNQFGGFLHLSMYFDSFQAVWRLKGSSRNSRKMPKLDIFYVKYNCFCQIGQN